jgi:hypothetical protein
MAKNGEFRKMFTQLSHLVIQSFCWSLQIIEQQSHRMTESLLFQRMNELVDTAC